MALFPASILKSTLFTVMSSSVVEFRSRPPSARRREAPLSRAVLPLRHASSVRMTGKQVLVRAMALSWLAATNAADEPHRQGRVALAGDARAFVYPAWIRARPLGTIAAGAISRPGTGAWPRNGTALQATITMSLNPAVAPHRRSLEPAVMVFSACVAQLDHALAFPTLKGRPGTVDSLDRRCVRPRHRTGARPVPRSAGAGAYPGAADTAASATRAGWDEARYKRVGSPLSTALLSGAARESAAAPACLEAARKNQSSLRAQEDKRKQPGRRRGMPGSTGTRTPCQRGWRRERRARDRGQWIRSIRCLQARAVRWGIASGRYRHAWQSLI